MAGDAMSDALVMEMRWIRLKAKYTANPEPVGEQGSALLLVFDKNHTNTEQEIRHLSKLTSEMEAKIEELMYFAKTYTPYKTESIDLRSDLQRLRAIIEAMRERYPNFARRDHESDSRQGS